MIGWKTGINSVYLQILSCRFMKRRITSLSRTWLMLLFPMSFMTVSCEKNIDEKRDNAPSHVQAIDLGLSVKWANCNIEASTPEAAGAYYAWGETEEKEEYTPFTYKYYLGDLNEDGNYYNFEEYKNIGNDISGTAYDVVRAKWGGSWRMPTREEFEELCLKCSWEATEINGIKGKTVTGPNGNSIFLPCTGIRTGTETANDANRIGAYWSATLSNPPSSAYSILFIYNDIVSGNRSINAYRTRGLAVRPVTE